MSVLSSPQGTPERVWSLVGGLGALGGELSHGDWMSMFNPGFLRAGIEQKAASTLAANSSGVAYALGLVARDGNRASLSVPDRPGTLSGFADEVHDLLCGAVPGELNAVILDAYAWVVAETHRRRDVGWLYDVGREEFADLADAALVGEDDDGRLMNTTKVPAWRRWLRFLGLGVPMPGTLVDFPSPARRIAIEVGRAGVAPDTVFGAEEFVRLIAGRCPYLDRGRLFAQACQRIGYKASPRALSALLSCGLRDLEADGLIALRMSGDAADGLSLAADPAAVQSTFNSVVVLRQEAVA